MKPCRLLRYTQLSFLMPQVDLIFKSTYYLTHKLPLLNMSFKMDTNATQGLRSYSFLPVSHWVWDDSVAYGSERADIWFAVLPDGMTDRAPYLWEWWSDSSGHSPAATDKKPLPATGLAPALRDSGWGLTLDAHCGPTCCSRWNHPADQGEKQQEFSHKYLTNLILSLNQ